MLSGAVGAVFLSASAFAQNPSLPAVGRPSQSAQGLPAVDGANWHMDLLGGSISRLALGAARAVIAAPLGNRNGFQLDLQGGSLDGRAFGSAAGHLFWRDPSTGLLGLYGSFTGWDRYGGVYAGQVAGEAEFYWGRWTLQGIAGVEFGNSAGGWISQSTSSSYLGAFSGPAVFTDTNTLSTFYSYDIRTRFFDQVNLRYFVTDDWDVYVGHRYLGGLNALALGSELSFRLPNSNMVSSLFVEGRVGEGDFQGVWGGLKFYFGNSNKSRIRRHREDDPNQWDTLFTILNSRKSSSSSSSSSSFRCVNGTNLEFNDCEF